MKQRPNFGEQSAVSAPEQVRAALVQRLGDTATRQIVTNSSFETAQALPDLGPYASDAQQQLRRNIVHLGGRQLALVDIAFAVDACLDLYLEQHRGYLPRAPLFERTAPQLLRALTPHEQPKVHKQLRRVWNDYVAEKYGLFSSAQPQKGNKGSAFPKNTKPRRTSALSSLEQSRKAHQLMHPED